MKTPEETILANLKHVMYLAGCSNAEIEASWVISQAGHLKTALEKIGVEFEVYK